MIDSEQGTLGWLLQERVELISRAHLDRSVSMRSVLADAVESYYSAVVESSGRADAFDLGDANSRHSLADFLFSCVQAVEEPENPQFPVRR
ncbi:MULTISPECIES: hypothetical protein [Rhodococcus]|uniref:Uncharacterized protein n=1 Tax=Rhodococcus cerastii TaxID=908616 RepID=A0ABU4D549_9NOCA|nr:MULTISPECIES: hypothetical protein [Rhodococcus]MDV6304429.1 hypothetical protein [Rhodococcus cerastii]MDV7991235.1 hypothetical protein [Rhodococcus sp. IEGM 1374]MDV8077546.1 hypothetical protein [Rhodococcus sp. IEGM 1370]